MNYPSHTNNTLPLILNKIHNKLTLQIAQGHLNVPQTPREIHLLHPQKAKQVRRNSQQQRNSPVFKSQFSPQDKRRIKELKERMIVFERNLEQKSKYLSDKQREQAQRARVQQDRKLRQEWQRHREAVLIRKQQKWLQKKEQSLLKNDQQTSKASKKRILYKQIEKEREVQEQLQEKARAELLSVLSQQRRNLVNISKLGQHEKSYIQRMKEEKADRMRKMEEVREATRRMQDKQIRNSLKSKFYDRVITEIQEHKKGIQQAQREKKRSQQKLRDFLQKIRSESALIADKHKKDKKTVTSKQQSTSTIIGRRSITQVELNQIGNRFLRDSLQHINKNTSKRSVSTQPQLILPSKKNNYLQELKQNRLKTQGDSNILLFHQSKIEKILVSPYSREQKVQKLKKLAYRLQAGHSSDAEVQLLKIQAKMKILDATLKAGE